MLKLIRGNDFLDVKADFVVAAIAGESDAVGVADFTTHPWLANRDILGRRDAVFVFLRVLDLNFVKSMQKGAESDEHEGGQ